MASPSSAKFTFSMVCPHTSLSLVAAELVAAAQRLVVLLVVVVVVVVVLVGVVSFWFSTFACIH